MKLNFCVCVQSQNNLHCSLQLKFLIDQENKFCKGYIVTECIRAKFPRGPRVAVAYILRTKNNSTYGKKCVCKPRRRWKHCRKHVELENQKLEWLELCGSKDII